LGFISLGKNEMEEQLHFCSFSDSQALPLNPHGNSCAGITI